MPREIQQILDAISNADSDFPGLAELRQEITDAG